MALNLFVGEPCGETSFLLHAVEETVVPHVRFTDVDTEVDRGDEKKSADETTEVGATQPSVYHCDCAPSITSLTMRSSA